MPLELFTPKVTQQKLDYIHNNPVEAGIVEKPEDYRYSSAKVYAGEKGFLEVLMI
jgi:putative transposase